MSFLDFFRPIYYMFMNMVTAIITIFIRRDRSIILMGSWYGYRFGGNTRYLFQYLSEYKTKYSIKKVIWVTRSKELFDELSSMEYEVYMMKSFKGIYYHFKAGIHAVSVNTSTSSATSKTVRGDILGELSLGAKKFYLNHAVSALKGNKFTEYKRLGKKDKFIVDVYNTLHSLTPIRHYLLYPGGWDRAIYLSPARETTKRDCRRHVKTEKITYVENGFPELCECLKLTSREQEILKIMASHKKVILYLPTYRTSPNTGYVHPLNNSKVCQYLKEHQYFWIDKLHPGAKEEMNARYYDPQYAMKLEAEFDMNVLVHHIDVMITDYSTVCQKAIYFDVPLIYYMQDYHGYVKYDKSLIKEFLDDISGIVAKNEEELCNALELCMEREEYMNTWRDKYKAMKQKYFDGRISRYEDIVDSLKKYV